jgi:hypothetical protein
MHIHYEGKWEGVGSWNSRVFWALWNSIEPIGECHLGPKNSRTPKHYARGCINHRCKNTIVSMLYDYAFPKSAFRCFCNFAIILSYSVTKKLLPSAVKGSQIVSRLRNINRTTPSKLFIILRSIKISSKHSISQLLFLQRPVLCGIDLEGQVRAARPKSTSIKNMISRLHCMQ